MEKAQRQSIPFIRITSFLALLILCIASPAPCPAQPRNGQHDFDFNIGTWKTHVRRLLHPLTGTNEWVDLNGTVQVRRVWNVRAQLEEIEADGPTGHFEGLTLFLYNPEGRQWAQYFADGEAGVVNKPQTGEFKNGRGEFFGQESLNGRTVLARFTWSNITPDSHKVEQSFSDDGGKTWELNFAATLTRDEATPVADKTHLPLASVKPDGARDFDFHFGVWKTHIRRLLKPLNHSRSWTGYDGTSVVSEVWGGRASLLELEASGPAGHIEGLGLRLFNPTSHQWSLNWTNSADPILTTPMVGRFAGGRGQFYDMEEFQGEMIMARNGFSDITSNSSHFEQAFSQDAGKTWETNWVMVFKR
jgi:hypothetical protein